MKNGIATSAKKTEDTLISVMSHELTHWMEKKSPELYEKYSRAIFESLESSTGKLTSDRIFDEIKRMTKRDGKSYTEEDAIHEIVARASEDMFAKSETVQEILDSLTDEEKQTFVGKVKEILTQFKQWISEFLGLYKSDSEEAEALRKAADDIDALIKMWDDMLKKSLTANKALETAKARENKNSADKDGVVQLSNKITAEDTDARRTEILSKKVLLHQSTKDKLILLLKQMLKNLTAARWVL